MNMKVRPGYKLTEVGVIPEEWEASTIGENSVWMSGGTPRRDIAEFWSGIIPWISGSTLKKSEISTSDQFLTAEAVSVGSKMAPVDSTLLLVRGSALHNEIRAGLVVFPVAFNQDVKALVPNETIEPKFLTYYILAYNNDLLNLVSSAGNSAGVLDTVLVQSFKFLKPPLPEQHAIANVLSDADALIESLEQLIAKKRQIKQGAMQELLTGKRRLPGFSGDWKDTTLGEIGECIIGLTYKPENVVGYGLLVLRSSNIQNGRLTYDDNVFVNISTPEHLTTQVGDIVICVRNGSRALIGKSTVVDESTSGLTFGAFMSVFRTKHWRFVAHVFQGDSIQRQIRDNIGATINQITNKDMKGFRVQPPSESEQIAIATILSDMDAEITTLETKLAKARQIKTGMMQELLTGRIRLI